MLEERTSRPHSSIRLPATPDETSVLPGYSAAGPHFSVAIGGWRGSCSRELVDLATVRFPDLKQDPLVFESFAFARNPPECGIDETRDGGVLIVVQVDAQHFLDALDRNPGGDDVVPLRVLGDLKHLANLVLIMNFSRDFLQDVLDGDESGQPAILVNDHGHVGSLVLQFSQQLRHALGFRHKLQRSHQTFQAQKLSGVLIGAIPNVQQILQIHHADDVFDLLAVNRYAGILGLGDELFQLSQRRRDLNGDDLGSGSHDIAGEFFAKLHSRLDERRLVLLQDSFFLADVDESSNLLFDMLVSLFEFILRVELAEEAQR